MTIQILTAIVSRRQCMNNEKDPFGFANAIQIEHLTDEQINVLEKIFEDYK